MFERLFAEEMGGGYPRERVIPEQRNARLRYLSRSSQISISSKLDITKKLQPLWGYIIIFGTRRGAVRTGISSGDFGGI